MKKTLPTLANMLIRTGFFQRDDSITPLPAGVWDVTLSDGFDLTFDVRSDGYGTVLSNQVRLGSMEPITLPLIGMRRIQKGRRADYLVAISGRPHHIKGARVTKIRARIHAPA